MKTVHKYAIGAGANELKVPRGAKPLAVQVQNSAVQLWALVETTHELADVRVTVVGTGRELRGDVGNYVDTFQIAGGALVFHVFWKEVR